MADAQTWKGRVEAWRASGKGADDFCSREDFSAGLLRHWAWRLGMTRRRRGSAGREPDRVPLARVIKTRTEALTPIETRPAARGRVRLMFGGARIEVVHGFDATVLRSVLDVLEDRAAARRPGR